MKYILQASEISELFSLTEALNWVAFLAPAVGGHYDQYDIFENPRSVFAEEDYPYQIGNYIKTNVPFYPEYPSLPSPQLVDIMATRDSALKEDPKKIRIIQK